MFPFMNPVQAMNLAIRSALLMSEAQMILAMRMMTMAGLWRQPRPAPLPVAPAAPAAPSPAPPATLHPAPRANRAQTRRAAGRAASMST